jgi:hypothetical protein
VASGPDNAGTVWDCQTGRVRQARREGVRETSVSRYPLKKTPAPTWRIWAGCGAKPFRVGTEWGTPGPGTPAGLEAMVKVCGVTHGDTAGAEPDTSPDDRRSVNVGTAYGSPPGAQPVRGREGTPSADGLVGGAEPP